MFGKHAFKKIYALKIYWCTYIGSYIGKSYLNIYPNVLHLLTIKYKLTIIYKIIIYHEGTNYWKIS